jgi:very-short-patch-repair endonuclease
MAGFTVQQRVWLSLHQGVASRQQLRDLGLTDQQIMRRARDGALVVLSESVYAVGGVPVRPVMVAVAACAASCDVAMSHTSAARLWGLRAIPRDERVHLLAWGASRKLLRGCVVHRCFRIEPCDIRQRDDGLRFTSPARTLFDLAACASDRTLESLVEQAVHDSLCSIAELSDAADRLGERGRPGSARFRRVLRSRPTDAAAVGSGLELRFEAAVLAAGLPRPERQHPITVAGGVVLHPDFYWPQVRFAVEVDHVTWHGGRHDRSNDNRRDRLLRAEGIEVRRVTDAEIANSMADVVADIERTLRIRAN